MSRACAASASARAVATTPRPDFTISGSATIERSFPMRWLTADWVTPSFAAAPVTDPVSTTATSSRRRRASRSHTGHAVHRIRQIFPNTSDALDLRLTAQLTFGADLASHACNFRRERAKLIDHCVDSVLETEHFALRVHRDFARKVAVGDGRSNFGDVVNLVSQV